MDGNFGAVNGNRGTVFAKFLIIGLNFSFVDALWVCVDGQKVVVDGSR